MTLTTPSINRALCTLALAYVYVYGTVLELTQIMENLCIHAFL